MNGNVRTSSRRYIPKKCFCCDEYLNKDKICFLCDQKVTYYDREEMIDHIDNDHLHTCNRCGLYFRSRENMITHREEVHPN